MPGSKSSSGTPPADAAWKGFWTTWHIVLVGTSAVYGVALLALVVYFTVKCCKSRKRYIAQGRSIRALAAEIEELDKAHVAGPRQNTAANRMKQELQRSGSSRNGSMYQGNGLARRNSSFSAPRFEFPPLQAMQPSCTPPQTPTFSRKSSMQQSFQSLPAHPASCTASFHLPATVAMPVTLVNSDSRRGTSPSTTGAITRRLSAQNLIAGRGSAVEGAGQAPQRRLSQPSMPQAPGAVSQSGSFRLNTTAVRGGSPSTDPYGVNSVSPPRGSSPASTWGMRGGPAMTPPTSPHHSLQPGGELPTPGSILHKVSSFSRKSSSRAISPSQDVNGGNGTASTPPQAQQQPEGKPSVASLQQYLTSCAAPPPSVPTTWMPGDLSPSRYAGEPCFPAMPQGQTPQMSPRVSLYTGNSLSNYQQFHTDVAW